MVKYILKRLLMMIPVLLGVTLVIFTLMAITPGDPAAMILGDSASKEDIEAMRETMGLDDPFLLRYFNFIFDAATKGDLGRSYVTKQPVTTTLLGRFPTSLTFAALVVCVSALIGIPLGIISATRQYSFIDKASMTVGLLGVSMPTFWLSMLMVLLFAVKLGWFPSSGFYGPYYWILPSVTLGFRFSASITRMTRSSMLEVIRQDYIRTARAKGQSERVVIWKHALKNALLPILTVMGLQFGNVLGSAVVTEQIFSIPGLGKLMVDSIASRDYPMVQGGVLLIAISFSFINLIVDILYALVDPRLRSMYGGGKRATHKRKEKELVKGEA